MKNNHFRRFLFGIALTALITIMSVVDVSAAALPGNNIHERSARDKDWAVGDHSNNFIVAAPYWQVGSDSYTFIAVSHSSLSGMASQIGLKINAITSQGEAYDTAESFTILNGATERVFIVKTNHGSINSTSVPTAKFLAGTSDFTYGHVRINPVATHPQLKVFGVGGYTAGPTQGNMERIGDGFRDITMLTYWGSIIMEAQTTGFAMEFVGDLNDSQAPTGLHSVDFVGGAGVNLQ